MAHGGQTWTEIEYERLLHENSLMRELLEVMVDINDEECRHDHHGYCQSHYLEESCTIKKAKEILKEKNEKL